MVYYFVELLLVNLVLIFMDILYLPTLSAIPAERDCHAWMGLLSHSTALDGTDAS